MFITRNRFGLALPAAAMALVLAAGFGCDSGELVPNPEKNPDARPAPAATAPAVTTQPATRASAKVPALPPQPVQTFMTITLGEGTQPATVTFPPAKVRLKKSPEGMQAVLYTDDPPAAASRDYKGNSYLFEMDLADVNEPADLPRAKFQYHVEGSAAAVAERDVETTNGIFLNGFDTHLQPVEVMVVFDGRPPQLMAQVVGTFRVMSAEKEDAPRFAMVQAMLPAVVDGAKK
jgi:hypothetical protein